MVTIKQKELDARAKHSVKCGYKLTTTFKRREILHRVALKLCIYDQNVPITMENTEQFC